MKEIMDYLEKLKYGNLTAEQEKEIDAVKEKYDEMIKLAELYNLNDKILRDAKAKEIQEIKEKETQFNQEYWDSMGVQLQTGAESLDEYVANVKSAAKEAIGAAIASGVASAITKSLQGSFLTTPWMIPIIAGLGAGFAKSAFNSLIPSFAEGGLVSSSISNGRGLASWSRDDNAY